MIWKDHEGNEFETRQQMCNHHHISVNTFETRRTRGWSLERCLTQPPQPRNVKKPKKKPKKYGDEYAEKYDLIKGWNFVYRGVKQ